VHFYTMNLRTQLAKAGDGKGIKIVEIAPPTVGTSHHRDRKNPDDNKKENNKTALTVEEFMGFVRKGLEVIRILLGRGCRKAWLTGGIRSLGVLMRRLLLGG
jgi:short-subunit dehydrogenase involved in D-alanine esterification of teichoic acids